MKGPDVSRAKLDSVRFSKEAQPATCQLELFYPLANALLSEIQKASKVRANRLARAPKEWAGELFYFLDRQPESPQVADGSHAPEGGLIE
jgi:hypothetical protein